MEQLGQWLKSTREARGITRLKAGQETRLRIQFLTAIEDGDYKALPPRFYARGMVRTYAQYLGLEPAKALELLEKELGPEARYDLQQVAKPISRPTIITGSTLTVLFLIASVTALLVFVNGMMENGRDMADGRAGATPMVRLGGVAQAQDETTPTPAPTVSPTALPTATPTPLQEIVLETKILDRSWVRVATDGRTVFEGILVAGNTRVWKATDKIVVRSGNGAGVEITFNGKKQGAMGSRGEVIERTWTRPE